MKLRKKINSEHLTKALTLHEARHIRLAGLEESLGSFKKDLSALLNADFLSSDEVLNVQSMVSIIGKLKNNFDTIESNQEERRRELDNLEHNTDQLIEYTFQLQESELKKQIIQLMKNRLIIE